MPQPIIVQFAAADADWDAFAPHLTQAFTDAGLTVALARDHAPATVDYIIFAPTGPLPDFPAYTHARAVLSLWAGVERIATIPSLTQPLARMVDDGMTQAMVEYVTGHVLRHHLDLDRDILGHQGRWTQRPVRAAACRPVTILGQGALGGAAGRMLAHIGFPVTGWSRTPRPAPHLTASFAGLDELPHALARAEIIVLLVPFTPDTENLMNARTLALPPRGAILINPGRGRLIDDDALLAALDTGQIGHATLDVFRTEPLPPDHRFWHHPRVTVTPHIAATTPPETSARVIAANIRRDQSGEPLLHLVDRARGY